MKVRIEFPQDIAKEKAEEAKEWTPGTPMVWEAEDINAPLKIRRDKEKETFAIETKHTKVELTKEEVQKIIESSE